MKMTNHFFWEMKFWKTEDHIKIYILWEKMPFPSSFDIVACQAAADIGRYSANEES
jgi:hypothetical protein